MLIAEVSQSADEGINFTDEIRSDLNSLDPIRDAWNEERIDEILRKIDGLPRNDDLDAKEPNDLSEIRKQQLPGSKLSKFNPSRQELRDRLTGAWSGRIVGCALGLPYEKVGCEVVGGKNVGPDRVRFHLVSTSNFPMKDFAISLPDPDNPWGSQSLSSTINSMEPDDDIQFTIANLCVFEEYGHGFNWENIAKWWLSHFPLTELCTAEVQSLLNYISKTARWGSDGGDASIACPQFTRRHKNPYREWIGAQIRSDFWGWLSPGNPDQASEFAYRDASWTHERNGIYGAMFFSAMQSIAYTTDDRLLIVEHALNYIPQHSRLTEAVKTTVAISETTSQWDESVVKLHKYLALGRSHDLSPVHVINNAAICVLAFLKGTNHPLEATQLAVMSGLDTDCNGATVGAISGVLYGIDLAETVLSRKLNGVIKTRIPSMETINLSELVERTLNLI